MTNNSSMIPLLVNKLLTDKLKEKRKQGGEELAKLVATLSEKHTEKIDKILEELYEMCKSVQLNERKGGLWGISACAMELADHPGYLKKLIEPVLLNMNHRDGKVRFCAMETIYNIVRMFPEQIISNYMDKIFKLLCDLSADPDTIVKNATTLLFRKMKDIIGLSEVFDLTAFMKLYSGVLREATNPYVRQQLISWLVFLESVPRFDLLKHLDQFFNPLFQFLSDPNGEIVHQTKAILEEIRTTILKTSPEELPVEILMTSIIGQSISDCDPVKCLALVWMRSFVSHLKAHILKYTSDILLAILPSISDKDERIRNAASQANFALLTLVSDTEHSKLISFSKLIAVLQNELSRYDEASRICALNWIKTLIEQDPELISSHTDQLLKYFLSMLKDPAHEIVTLTSDILGSIGTTEDIFPKLITQLLGMFDSDKQMMGKSGFIIKQFSVIVNPSRLYKEIATILAKDEETFSFEFKESIVQNLNMILLTTNELEPLREVIQFPHKAKEGASSIFNDIALSWCYHPVSILSLCLLAGNYRHAWELVSRFPELNLSVPFFVSIDNLIQLLEAPLFVNLRMHMLRPLTYPYLIRSLYGILMVLPQSKAYHLLLNRLNCIQVMTQIDKLIEDGKPTQSDDKQSIDDLLGFFSKVNSLEN